MSASTVWTTQLHMFWFLCLHLSRSLLPHGTQPHPSHSFWLLNFKVGSPGVIHGFEWNSLCFIPTNTAAHKNDSSGSQICRASSLHEQNNFVGFPCSVCITFRRDFFNFFIFKHTRGRGHTPVIAERQQWTVSWKVPPPPAGGEIVSNKTIFE